VPMGRISDIQIHVGEAALVHTGGAIPEGASAVVMLEDTQTVPGGEIEVLSALGIGKNVIRLGEDIQEGERVLEIGQRLRVQEIGGLMALGRTRVSVFRRPRVAILSTGDEIIEPGQPLGPGQIYDINHSTLNAIVPEHGGIPVKHPRAGDTLEELGEAVDACLAEDIVVFSGGSSVGERDLILDVMMQKGEVLFHGIAVKPGKPTVFGRIAGKPVLGMPGYPTSCLSNAYMLLIPILRRLGRLPAWVPQTKTMPIAQRIVSTTGRWQFFTVRIVDGQAVPAFKASGDITSMSQADGYIEIPSHTDIVEKGEVVEVKFF